MMRCQKIMRRVRIEIVIELKIVDHSRAHPIALSDDGAGGAIAFDPPFVSPLSCGRRARLYALFLLWGVADLVPGVQFAMAHDFAMHRLRTMQAWKEEFSQLFHSAAGGLSAVEPDDDPAAD